MTSRRRTKAEQELSWSLLLLLLLLWLLLLLPLLLLVLVVMVAGVVGDGGHYFAVFALVPTLFARHQ